MSLPLTCRLPGHGQAGPAQAFAAAVAVAVCTGHCTYFPTVLQAFQLVRVMAQQPLRQ